MKSFLCRIYCLKHEILNKYTTNYYHPFKSQTEDRVRKSCAKKKISEENMNEQRNTKKKAKGGGKKMNGHLF